MPQSRRPARPGVPVRFSVDREGPPGDLSPLLDLLIHYGTQALHASANPVPGPGQPPADQAAEPELRLYAPDATEMDNSSKGRKGKKARARPKNPKPRKRRKNP